MHSHTLPQQAPGQRQVQQTRVRTRQGANDVGGIAYTAGVRKPRFVTEAADWFSYLTWRQIFGYLFALAGIVLTIVAVKIDPKNQLLIAVIAAFAQLIAATLFSRQGKADPTHAKRSVQRLIRLGVRVTTAETAACNSFEGTATASQRREHMGQISAELGYIGDGIYEAVRDWVAFNEPLNELVSEDQQKEILEAARESKKAEDSQQGTDENRSEEPVQSPPIAGR